MFAPSIPIGGDNNGKAITIVSELKEHLKLSTPQELKLLKVESDKFIHDDLWSRVDEIIMDYAKVHPIEMEIIVRENALIAASQFNKHGVSKEKGGSELRHHVRMPVALFRVLEAFCPELFSDRRNYHKFMKRYKGLRAYE